MKKINKLKVLSFALLISLTGCETNLETIKSSSYEEFTFDDLSNLKIINFEYCGNNMQRLVYKNTKNMTNPRSNIKKEKIEYIDLETNLTLIRYFNNNDVITYEIGKDINITSEEELGYFIIDKNTLKNSYSKNEIFDIYNNIDSKTKTLNMN